jgi:hypothetical protein
MTLALAALLAALTLPENPDQAEAARTIGATNPIHFDLGKRPRHRRETPSGGTQPAITMAFHGGPVQVTTTAYLIWWLPSGQTLPSNYRQVVTNYFNDVGGSSLYDVLTVYSGSNGQITNSVTPGGAWTDTTAYPASIGYDAIVASVKRALAANPGWPPGLGSQFYVLTSQSAPVAGNQFCAYHSFFKEKKSDVIFAYIPDPVKVDGCQTPFNVSPNDDLDVDSATTSINHEQAEMASDPLIDAWYSDSPDKYVKGSEIADVCIYDFGIPLHANGANFVFANGDQYVVQALFDKSAGICAPTL